MSPPPIGPEPIFQALTRYWVSATLKTALDLDLFTAVAAGEQQLAGIARRIGAPERSTRIPCDALVGVGFLGKNAARYELTPISDVFLDRNKPSYFGSMANIVTQTPSGDTYTPAEYRRMFADAGFREVELRPGPGVQTFVLAKL